MEIIIKILIKELGLEFEEIRKVNSAEQKEKLILRLIKKQL